jgi:hypothetical protein
MRGNLLNRTTLGASRQIRRLRPYGQFCGQFVHSASLHPLQFCPLALDEVRLELLAGVLDVTLIHDVLAVKHRAGPVTADFHRHFILEARSLHVPHCGSAQVVEEQARNAGALAGLRPAIEMISHGPIPGAIEYPWIRRRPVRILNPEPHHMSP